MDEDWVPIEGAFGTVLALGGADSGDLVRLHVKRDPEKVRGVGAADSTYYKRGVVGRISARARDIPIGRREGETREDAFVVFAFGKHIGGVWVHPEEVIAFKKEKS